MYNAKMEYKASAPAKLLGQLEFLYEKYSEELRATTQPYYLRKVIQSVPYYQYNPEDILVRETLMEHAESLPVVATAFYSYIDDAESQTSKSAKFAKAIDKITPDIIDYLTPADVTIQRFKHFVGIGPKD